MTFLGGITATCFVDHLAEDQSSTSSYKIGQKVTARVVSTDPVSKKVTVSLKSSLVNWKALQTAQNDELHKLSVGQAFENAKVSEELYGGSYLVSCQESGSKSKLMGFLHKTHSREEPVKDQSDDAEEDQDVPTKRQKVRDQEL